MSVLCALGVHRMKTKKPWRACWQDMPIKLSVGMRGITPRSYATNVAPAVGGYPPLEERGDTPFFIPHKGMEKERWGRKKKPWKTIRRGEADAAARGKRCVAAGFRPHKRRGIFLDLMSPQVRPLIITRQQRSAFCQPRLAPA